MVGADVAEPATAPRRSAPTRLEGAAAVAEGARRLVRLRQPGEVPHEPGRRVVGRQPVPQGQGRHGHRRRVAQRVHRRTRRQGLDVRHRAAAGRRRPARPVRRRLHHRHRHRHARSGAKNPRGRLGAGEVPDHRHRRAGHLRQRHRATCRPPRPRWPRRTCRRTAKFQTFLDIFANPKTSTTPVQRQRRPSTRRRAGVLRHGGRRARSRTSTPGWRRWTSRSTTSCSWPAAER